MWEIYDSFRIAAVVLNACLFIDLYLVILNPFEPGYLRVKWYVLMVAVAVIQTNLTKGTKYA